MSYELYSSPFEGRLGGGFKGRFAPSPTGRMHLGNVYSALLAWLSARSQGGGFVLRIEDIDQQRSRVEYARQIEDDLKWLGIDWDEHYVQSERFALYEDALKDIEAKGLTYPCYCTRADIMATQAPHESDGRVVYKGTCRPKGKTELRNHGITELRNYGITELGNHGTLELRNSVVPSHRLPSTRVLVPDRDITFTDGHYGSHTINLARQCGDFILRRADGAWAYQLAVVVDDALMGITEVVRGRDLLLSVPQQQYLFSLLGYPSPSYCHIPLLCNTSGQRLSKRDKSLDLGVLRQQYRPEDIIGRLACYAGIIDRPEPIAARELIPLFAWDKVPVDDICIPSN